MHDRDIHMRADDSVVRASRGARAGSAAVAGLRAGGDGPGAGGSRTAGVRRRTEERILPDQGAARHSEPAHRGSGELRDAGVLRRNAGQPEAAVPRGAARRWRTTCTRAISAPDSLWGWRGCRRSECSTTMRTSRLHAGERAGRRGDRRGLRRHGVRHRRGRSGAENFLLAAMPDSSGARTSATCRWRAEMRPSGSPGAPRSAT